MIKSNSNSHSVILGKTHQSPEPDTNVKQSGKHRNTSPLQMRSDAKLVTQGHGHIITIAPPGSTKANSLIIPNLLHYQGPAVVVDSTGEYYAATAEKRESMGQKIYRLDPFGVIQGLKTDSINPLELISVSSSTLESECQMLVHDILSFPTRSADYWERLSVDFTSALIGYMCCVPDKKSLVRDLIKILLSDDPVYSLAVVLDTIGKRIPPFSYTGLAFFLKQNDIDRNRVLSTIYSYLQPFSSEVILKSLDDPGIPLDDLIGGDLVSIYLILPPDKLRIHSSVLRLWLETILSCISRRQKLDTKTLVMLDDCDQIGTIAHLNSSFPDWKKSGFLLWTFFQDINQASHLYSQDWIAMSTVLQVLSTKSSTNASKISSLLGVTTKEILLTPEHEQIIRLDGIAHRIENM